jgi:hypothetical protein
MVSNLLESVTYGGKEAIPVGLDRMNVVIGVLHEFLEPRPATPTLFKFLAYLFGLGLGFLR